MSPGNEIRQLGGGSSDWLDGWPVASTACVDSQLLNCTLLVVSSIFIGMAEKCESSSSLVVESV